LNKGTYKRKTHAQIKTIEQMYKQEDNTRTDKNNVQLFLSVRLFPLICTFVQLFLSVRVFSSCMYLYSIVFICACVFLLYVSLFNCFHLTDVQIETIEQRYKQEENTRTDKNDWTNVLTRRKHTHRQKQLNKGTYKRKTHAQIKTFNYFYLCVCIPLVCTFVQLFLSVRVFSSCLYLCSIVFICACLQQRYKQEENTRTDKNDWTNVLTRRKQTHR
jgi:uncharacterized membrane protein (DUF485 family)